MDNERVRVLEVIKASKERFDKVIDENIEKNRKGDFRLTLKSNGSAIKGAKIKIKQINHAFRFGANIFMLDELETPEKNEQYKSRFAELFNMATLPFYWESLEPEKGHLRYEKSSTPYYRRPAIDLCMEFCAEHGIEPREHALAYENQFPRWLSGASIDEVKRELERRYGEISSRYADKIRTIEVTNEMFWWHFKTEFYNDDNYIEWCFKLARKYFPKNQLVVNESTEECWLDACRMNAKYASYIQANLLKGAPIDAIGMQFHMFYPREREYEKAKHLYDAEFIYNRLDLYSRLRDALQITEITIPAYSNDPFDEQVQADIIEHLYRIWFSHPATEQIIYWNLIDGYAYVPNPTPEAIRHTQGNMSVGENVYYGGLLRFDMSPKPAYLKLKELITEVWHTELEADIDETGCVDFRGFYGDYELEIELDGRKIKQMIALTKEGKEKEIII